MDQEQSSEALTPSSAVGTKKLNAEAPEFVPASLPRRRHLRRRLGPVEFAADGKNGSTATSTKNGLSDSHQKIINQVEFYFSDINLATTDQLFRYMCKDPEGYVPLSVVASFKKIKTAISDSTQLASILRSSNKLFVSEDGKKVKRQHPLTESDMEELQSRIVIAENLPEDHSHQNLMKIFSSVGSVKSIRTCPPQHSNNGASYASKAGKGDGLHFSGKFHAFVEYESAEVAERAVAELKDDGNWRNCLKVRLLLKSVVKPTHTRAKKVVHEGQSAVTKDETIVPEMQGFKENHLEDTLRQSDKQNHELQLEDTAKSNGQKKARSSLGGSGNGNGNGKGKGKGQSRGRPQHPTNGGNISASHALEVSSSNEKLNIAKGSSVPRMPDGTKGFSMGRGKPRWSGGENYGGWQLSNNKLGNACGGEATADLGGACGGVATANLGSACSGEVTAALGGG
ncbi:La-related protein 6B [Sesamum alatum]|uniref:La-related protein 6B n=1 Tax=Sesamum alatum TaxID=300844 RepID=A0AAE1Y1C5_9LAMI|nr:La-related protein 6B [Sesamum alatum]